MITEETVSTRISKIAPYLIGMALLSLLPLAIGSDLTKRFASVIILAYSLLGFGAFYRSRSLISFLAPNSLVFFYVTSSMTLGAFALQENLVPVNFSEIFFGITTLHISISFLLSGLMFLPLIQAWVTGNEARSNRRLILGGKSIAIITIVFVIVGLFQFDLAAVGGQGDLNSYILNIYGVCIIIYSLRFATTVRYIIFLILLAVMSQIFYYDKLMAIFLVLPFVFNEFRAKVTITSSRHFLYLGAIFFAVLYSILAMSVSRGYGQFDTEGGLLEAALLVPSYISTPEFLVSFFQNIEVSYFFIHFVNAVDLVANGHVDLTYGSTIWKTFLLPIPREVLPIKPESIISLYTNSIDPFYRNVGGSWPPNFAADYFWAFHAFGLVFFPVFAYLNSRLFRYLISESAEARPFLTIVALYAYMHVLTYARGSGLDMYVFTIFVPALFMFVSSFIERVITRKHAAV